MRVEKNIIGNLWLSPEGRFISCSSHSTAAEVIVADRYGTIKTNPEDFLMELGWMKYVNRSWGAFWLLDSEFEEPTQAQQNTIFSLTGEIFKR